MKNQKPPQDRGIPSKPNPNPSISAPNRRSRWDNADPKLSSSIPPEKLEFPPKNPPNLQFPAQNQRFDAPPPVQSYGFQDLEKRTIVLADGSFRSYFALPSDGDGLLGQAPIQSAFNEPNNGQKFVFNDRNELNSKNERIEAERNRFDRDEFNLKRSVLNERDEFNSKRNDGKNVVLNERIESERNRLERDDLNSKRKSAVSESEDLRGKKQARIGDDVSPDAVNRAFLRLARMIFEDPSLKKNLMNDGKLKPLTCLACGRSSKNFGDLHALIMHTYHSQNAALRIDHLGLHKALCVLMGWDFERVPETNKVYQSLPSETAIRNREDLILWPPTLIIHIADSGPRKEAMGSKDIDAKLKDLGISAGRPRMIDTKMAMVRFSEDKNGLREAERAEEKLEREGLGRRGWARVSNPPQRRPGGDKKGEAIFGYLALATDLENLDDELKKQALLRSRRNL